MQEIPQSRRIRLMRAIKKLPNLIAYYPMLEAEGSVCRNRAPATLGTLNGAITGATIGQTGLIGRAYSFDGINDKLEISGGAPLYNNTAFTIMMLIRNTNIAQDNTYIYAEGRSTTNTPLYGLNFNAASSSIVFFVRGDDGVALTGTSASWTVNENQWFLLTVVDDNGSVSLYKNTIKSTNNHNYTRTTLTLNRRTVMFLGRTGDAQYAKGDIQHLALCTRALNVTQINKIARIAGLA